ncbi:hypothetical protein BaRGS_00028419, partial [Batillaria attramentaria]
MATNSVTAFSKPWAREKTTCLQQPTIKVHLKSAAKLAWLTCWAQPGNPGGSVEQLCSEVSVLIIRAIRVKSTLVNQTDCRLVSRRVGAAQCPVYCRASPGLSCLEALADPSALMGAD